tara:strand:+ start:131 stop:388 length:258 start_codon:yes stop_codon:yes gene_type:complete
MWLEVVLKCDTDNAPYRVYINDDLITERFYAITLDSRYAITNTTISNNLLIELVDDVAYDVRVESLTDTEVLLSDYTIREKLDEN